MSAEQKGEGVQAGLTWSLEPDPNGHALRVEYQVENTGDEAIYCLDRMDPFADADDAAKDRRIIAIRSPRGPQLWLIRGFFLHPNVRAMAPWVPGVREIPAGQSVSGRAEAPLPLRQWHPNTGERPLDEDIKDIRLQIGVAPLSLPLEEMELSDGRTIRRPKVASASQYQRMLLSDPLPLPH